MSGEIETLGTINGYLITVMKIGPTGDTFVCLEADLKLNKTGGAHITNAESLIAMIEVAVFMEEEEMNSEVHLNDT